MKTIGFDKLIEKVSSKVIQNFIKENSYILNEGVVYDETTDSFTFNFENDNETDIIQLQKVGYKIKAFNRCYYYAYEFSKNVDSKVRTAFIHSIKFPDEKISEDDKKTFIINAVNKLDDDISLPSYKLIVYPESMSELNREMLRYLNRIAFPEIVDIELIKSLPSKIEFDYKRFDKDILQTKLPNGRYRYTEKQKEEVLNKISQMMDDIHNLKYFSIARNVKKTKYRQFIKNYYTFKNKDDKELFEKLLNSNVLIIDDIVTSGTIISLLLNCLRSVNDTNNIVIFSLIGKSVH